MTALKMKQLEQRIERIEQFLFRNNDTYSDLDHMLDQWDGASLVASIVSDRVYVSTTSELRVSEA